MPPLVTSLEGEGCFKFKRIEQKIHIIKEKRENADKRFQLVYAEAVTLIKKLGTEEK